MKKFEKPEVDRLVIRTEAILGAVDGEQGTDHFSDETFPE